MSEAKTCISARIEDYFEDPRHKRLSRALREELDYLELKYCYGCQCVKELSGFNRQGGGYRSQCRECRHSYHYANHERELMRMRNYKAANAEAIAVQCKRYRELNPLPGRIRDGYRRAEKLGAPSVDFKAKDVYEYWESVGIDPWVSAYSGTPLSPENYSLDHIVPLSAPGTPGHTPTNLVPCTQSENKRKHNRRVLPFRLLALLALKEEKNAKD